MSLTIDWFSAFLVAHKNSARLCHIHVAKGVRRRWSSSRRQNPDSSRVQTDFSRQGETTESFKRNSTCEACSNSSLAYLPINLESALNPETRTYALNPKSGRREVRAQEAAGARPGRVGPAPRLYYAEFSRAQLTAVENRERKTKIL